MAHSHVAAVRPNLLGQGRAGWPLRRQAICRKPPAIASAPRRRDPGLQPGRRGGGQHVERMAERFADALQPIEGLDERPGHA